MSSMVTDNNGKSPILPHQLNDYQILYHDDAADGEIAINMTHHRLCLIIVREEGQYDVYHYLMEHRNPIFPIVYDCFRQKEGCVIVSEEYINGQTLHDILSKELPSIDSRTVWFSDLCRGLSFLHKADPAIIHRDVKSENVLIDDRGQARLIDFGAAKCYRPEANRDTILIGTDGIAAPEQYGFAQSDARTDIYALGKLLQELFPEAISLRKVIEKATRIDPKDRFQKVEEMETAVFTNLFEEGLLKEKYRPEPEFEQNIRTDRSKGRPKYDSGKGMPSEGGKPFGPLPGFRTGKPWKMFVAVDIYALLIVFSFTLKIDNVSGKAELCFWRILILMIALLIIDVSFLWGPVVRGLPGVQNQKPLFSWLFRIMWIIILTILLLTFASAVFFVLQIGTK